MDQVICRLTLKKREWLADFISNNKRLPKGEQLKREDIPRKLNTQFPETGFTISNLLHLYTYYGGQGKFIAKTREEVRKAESKEASKVKAPLKRKTEPVKAAPSSGIDRPPKKHRKPKPVAIASAPVEEPVAKIEPEAESEAEPPFNPVFSPPTRAPVPRPRAARIKLPADPAEADALKKITPEESTTIALALGSWDSSMLSGSAFGYAAMKVNETRLGERRPLAEADAVRSHVLGKKKEVRDGVESFVGSVPAFAKAFPKQEAAIAERVAAYKPPPRN